MRLIANLSLAKKFTVRTLSKRAITFVPEVIPDEINDDTELFGQLVIFCEISAKIRLWRKIILKP